MHTAILSNPASGKLDVDEKESILCPFGKSIGAEVLGHNTRTREEFIELARDLAERCDILLVAGGDGTFADVLNGVPEGMTLGFIPLGTGVALATAMGLYTPGTSLLRNILGLGMTDAAFEKFYTGDARPIDIILYNEQRKTLMPSVGFEGEVLARKQYSGFKGYADSIGRVCIDLAFGK